MTEKITQTKMYTTTIKGGSCYANVASAHIIAGILIGVTGNSTIDVRALDRHRNSDWVIEQRCSAEQYSEFVEKMDELYVDNLNLGHDLIRFDRT